MTHGVQLHGYQKEARQALVEAHQRHQRILLSLPTGTGKTVVAGEYAASCYLERGLRVAWIAHSEELLDQACATFEDKLGVASRRICRLYAGHERLDAKPQAQLYLMNNRVASGPAEVDLIVIDEAHHAPASTYVDWLSTYKAYRDDGPKVLGLTATPYRLHEGDVPSLLEFSFSRPKVPIFEEIAFQRSFCELAAIGRLAPFRHISFNTGLRFQMKLQNGDFSGESLAQLNTPERNRFVFETWRANREKFGKTLIFVGRKEHAVALARQFGSDGDYVVSGEGGEARREVVERFRRGDLKVLVNVGIFVEGVDVPDIKTIILARPTTSPIRFMQMVGRGSRIVPGKTFFYLVDIHDQLGQYEDRLAGVGDLATGQPRLLEVVNKQAKAAEAVSSSRLGSLVQDTSVLLEVLSEPVTEILRHYVGWVSFETSKGEPRPVGTLLDEADFRTLEALADGSGRVPSQAGMRLGRTKGKSQSITKCGRALAEGLCGWLRRFDVEDGGELEALSKNAVCMVGTTSRGSLDGLRNTCSRVEAQAAEWGVPPSIIGQRLSEYRASPNGAAGALLLDNDKEVTLRWVGSAVLQILGRAIARQQHEVLGIAQAADILGELERADPDLRGYGQGLLKRMAAAKGLNDLVISL